MDKKTGQNVYFRTLAESDHVTVVGLSSDTEPSTVEKHLRFVRNSPHLLSYYVMIKTEREKPQEIVGAFCLLQMNSASVEIGNVVVRQDLRGKGLGKKLIQFAINRVRELKYSEAFLRTGLDNVAMQTVARTQGMKHVGDNGIHKEYSIVFDPNWRRPDVQPRRVPKQPDL